MQRHPDSIFYRVRWDEENLLGCEVLGRELAAELKKQKADLARRKSPANWAGNAVDNFMHWLLR